MSLESSPTILLIILSVALVIVIAIAVWNYKRVRLKTEENEQLTSSKKKMEAQMVELQAERAALEAEHLKFQLQPHTLNNILASLKVIASRLNRGMDSLSDTLDYILYKGNTHWVSVHDEIDFVKKYLKLNDLFVSEIDAVQLDIKDINQGSPHYNKPNIPHLVSAYFIENAFKHGDTAHPEFLRIQMKLNHQFFEMTVVNRIRHHSPAKVGGLGLNNMKKRLQLLLGDRFEIHHSCNESRYYARLTIYFNHANTEIRSTRRR